MDYEDDDDYPDAVTDRAILIAVGLCLLIVLALSILASDHVDYSHGLTATCSPVNSTTLNMATTAYCTR